MPYLMESPKEAERLLLKSDEETSRQQLLLTGLEKGMTAVDAGGGAGFVSKIMSDIVGPKGRVILLDQSKERLTAAKMHMKSCRNVVFTQTPLEKIKMDSASADYVFCRFVFEYLETPGKVFDEFVRIAKDGGKIVVGDLDYNCLSHYPLAPHLETQLKQITDQLAAKKLWDPYAGRKLFSYFHENNLKDVRVHLLPHHLIYGESTTRDLENWRAKLDQIQKHVEAGNLKFDFDIESFRNEFFAFFENPSRFSYSPLILVEGIKA